MKSLKERVLKTVESVLDVLSERGLTEGFYLTGGTALFLRYGHRISEDLDFFSLPETADFSPELLASRLSGVGRVEFLSRGTVYAVVQGVKVSFFSYSYPLLEEPERRRNILVASDADVTAAKLVAVAQRGSKKDFFDLHFLMQKHGWSLEDVLSLAERKYGQHGFVEHLIKGLTFFEDAEAQTVVLPDGRALDQGSWEKIKAFFEEQVKLFLRDWRNSPNP